MGGGSCKSAPAMRSNTRFGWHGTPLTSEQLQLRCSPSQLLERILDNDRIDVLAGELTALASVVTRLLETVTPAQAAKAQEALQIDRDTLRVGLADNMSETELATTELALDNYIALLVDVAES